MSSLYVFVLFFFTKHFLTHGSIPLSFLCLWLCWPAFCDYIISFCGGCKAVWCAFFFNCVWYIRHSLKDRKCVFIGSRCGHGLRPHWSPDVLSGSLYCFASDTFSRVLCKSWKNNRALLINQYRRQKTTTPTTTHQHHLPPPQSFPGLLQKLKMTEQKTKGPIHFSSRG